jgi:hypothetical protein
MSQPQVRPYVMSQTSGYLRQPDRIQSGKENIAVLWANDEKQSYPGLRFERGQVDGSGEKRKTQTRLGLVRAMKNSYCGRVTFG